MANTCALLKEAFDFLWVGFYIVDLETDTLVLGPFQGPLACTRIPFGKGVCGKSWENKAMINVSDVHKFEGHIACSSKSNSEIVYPIMKEEEVFAVLDIDSELYAHFDEVDEKSLKDLTHLLEKNHFLKNK